MLQLSEETRKLFLNIGNDVFVNYVLTFPNLNLTIDNEIIHTESVILKQSICEEDDLEFGGCIASSFEFEVSDVINTQLKGEMFQVEMQLVDVDGNVLTEEEIPIGNFKVDTVTRVDDQDYKKIIAYDQMYDAMDDVSEWYESFFPVLRTEVQIKKDDDGNEITEEVKIYDVKTLDKFRISLLNFLGIEYEDQRYLTNDNLLVKKTISTNGGTLSGQKLLKMICEIQGGFGVINRFGKFEIIYLKCMGLWPEETLYPDEMLWPEDKFHYIGQNEEETLYPEYKKAVYEEYICKRITKVKIQTDSEDAVYSSGDSSNPYIISGNYFTYGKTSTDLLYILKDLAWHYKNFEYRPATITMKALPYLDVGDYIALEKETDDIFTFVLSRTMTGVQGIMDEYVSRGNEYRDNVLNSTQEENYEDETTKSNGKDIDISNGSVHIETRYDFDDEVIFNYKDGNGHYNELIANKDGFYHSDYDKKTYQVEDENGALTDKDFTDGNYGSYNADGISLSKEIVSERMGNVTSNTIEGNITFEHYADDENNEPVGRFECDTDFYAPNISDAIIYAETFEVTADSLDNKQTQVDETDVSLSTLVPVAVFLQSTGGYNNCYGLELDAERQIVTSKIINISGATHSGGVVFVVLYKKDWGCVE